MSEFYNIENVEIEKISLMNLLQSKTEFQTVDYDNNIYKKGDILYKYIFTNAGETIEKAMITPIDYMCKIKDSNYKEYKYHNLENWIMVPTNKLLRAEACVDDFTTIVELNGRPSFEYKVAEFCKSPEQGMQLIHENLVNKLAPFKDLGFTIVFRIEPFLEPYTKLDIENKQLQWGFSCTAVIGIVKNPVFVEGEITQEERDEYKKHYNRSI